jgi:antitoxin HicB
MPLVRSLGCGLWEVRSSLSDGRIARVLGAQAKKRGTCVKKKNIGSSFDSWLRDEGVYEEVTATAIKRVLARQIEAAMKEKHFSKAEMARRMQTSRAALDRLLDPDYEAVTLSTLRKAAVAVGRQLRLELV